MGFNQQKIIRALRLCLTTLILFFFTWYYKIPEGIWSLFTIWLVMGDYNTVGGVFTKSLYRAAGTTLSAVYGLILIYFFHNNFFINLLALTPAVLVYCYLFMDGDKAYIATIGSVTLTLILLNYNQIDIAIIRTFNILLGIVASVFMIRFFYPQFARDELLVIQANILFLTSQMITGYMDKSLSVADIKKLHSEYEQNIYKQFTLINRLIVEAKIETAKTPEYVIYTKSAYEHLRHIFRLTSLFSHYFTSDYIRDNITSINNFETLLSKLKTTRLKIEEEHSLPTELPVTLEKILPIKASRDKNTQFIEILFDNLNEEIDLLDADFNEIVSIYKYYSGHFLQQTNG